jgi:hypothetical protein
VTEYSLKKKLPHFGEMSHPKQKNLSKKIKIKERSEKIKNHDQFLLSVLLVPIFTFTFTLAV